MYDIDFDLCNGSRSNVNASIEIKIIGDFECIENSNICSICHRLRDIHSRNVHEFEFDILNGIRSDVNIPIESQ